MLNVFITINRGRGKEKNIFIVIKIVVVVLNSTFFFKLRVKICLVRCLNVSIEKMLNSVLIIVEIKNEICIMFLKCLGFFMFFLMFGKIVWV